MAFSGVDKFPQVAKILVDMRLQELLEENRKLKEEKEKFELLVFWQTHNIDWLRGHIYLNRQTHLQCKCQVCHLHRTFNGRIAYCQRCSLLEFFWDFAEKHGFKVARASREEGKYENEFVAVENEDLGETWEMFCTGDAHFVIPSDTDDWIVLGYGERLSKARSVHDPEVVKLKEFFREITKLGWANH